MGVYGSAVLSFFLSGISVILILMCGIIQPRGVRFFVLLANGIR